MMMSATSVVAAALLLVCSGVAGDIVSYCLPLQVVPVSYDVSLVPYLDNEGNRSFTFDGIVRINVTTKKNASDITLHTENMTINSIEVSDCIVEKHEHETERSFLKIYLKGPLSVGSNHTITINYGGIISQGSTGFYRSSYKTEETTRWLGATQFEATHARKAFPCFDEPALKASFVIRIAPPVGYHAVSNMPLESIGLPDSTNNNRSWYNFKKSVVMSTYLVAFVVSDFLFLENGTFRIFARPDSVEFARYALSVSPLILSTIANLTGVKYSLPKLDQVVVPDFSMSAMENWGLITYKKDYLLDIDTSDSEFYRTLILPTIVHAFSHQWFGNLVTAEWWSHLWLKEAFATFFQYFVTDKVRPEWNYLETMVTEAQYISMISDRKNSFETYPIFRHPETPAEIESMFSSRTSQKGGSIVKMVYYFLTEQTFFKGLNIYLTKRAYASATGDDVYAAWQEAANADGVLPANLTVKGILDTWITQAGYPLLTVIRNYTAGTATITQERLVTEGPKGRERWYVPITYTTRSHRNFNTTVPALWLSPDEGSSVTLEGLANEDWLILNILSTAYYMVNYDEMNWKLLEEALNKTDYDGIPSLNRAQILEDCNVFSMEKILPPRVCLEIIRLLTKEKDPVVWSVMLRHVTHHYHSLSNSEHLSQLKTVFAPFFENVCHPRTRNIVAVDMGKAKDWASAFSTTCTLQPTLRGKPSSESPAKWCAAVRTDPDAWDAAWRRYKEASSVKERRDALAALGCAPDPQRLLSAAVADGEEEERVFEGDRVAALSAPCASGTRRAVSGGGAEACAQAVAFVKGNTARIQELLEDTEEYLKLVHRLAFRIKTEEQLNSLQRTATTNRRGQVPVLTTAVWSEVLLLARSRVRWFRGDGAPIVSWLQNQAAQT